MRTRKAELELQRDLRRFDYCSHLNRPMTATLVFPNICIVCNEASSPGFSLMDSITNRIEKYCASCYGTTMAIRKQEETE